MAPATTPDPRYGTPAMTPVWLSPDDVKTWLRVNDQDTSDDDLITAACAMTEPYAARCRPEFFDRTTNPPSYHPDAETYQGAVMYAAREYRRRNSPAGIETFGEVMSFIARYDSDIERAFQTGAYAPPITS